MMTSYYEVEVLVRAKRSWGMGYKRHTHIIRASSEHVARRAILLSYVDKGKQVLSTNVVSVQKYSGD